jgi:hypothetical protein
VPFEIPTFKNENLSSRDKKMTVLKCQNFFYYWFFIRVNGGLEEAFDEDVAVFH